MPGRIFLLSLATLFMAVFPTFLHAQTESGDEKAVPVLQDLPIITRTFGRQEKKKEVPMLRELPIVAKTFDQEAPERQKKSVPMLQDIPIVAKSFGRESAQDEKKDGVPILTSLPLLGHLFKKKGQAGQQQGGLTISPLRHNTKEKKAVKSTDYESSFLHRRQCTELLSRFRGLETVEIVESRKTRVGRDGAEISSETELKFEGSEEDKARARDHLAKWRMQDNKLVSISFYMIETKEKSEPTLLPHTFQAISNEDLQKALNKHKSQKGSQILSMPTVTVIHGQRAHVSIINEVAYVKDFDVEITSSAFIADPVVDTVKEGVVITTTPVIDVDGEGLALQIEAEVSSIQKPIPEFTTDVVQGTGTTMTIQLPQVYYNTKKTDDLRLRGNQMSFRVMGLRTFKGEGGRDTVHYELLGTAKIIH